jgi:hypothetical protein
VVRWAWLVFSGRQSSFENIFTELSANQFNLFNGVDSSKVAAFVNWVTVCRPPRPVIDERESQLEEEVDEDISEAVQVSMEYHSLDNELEKIVRQAERRLAPPIANVQEVIEMLNDNQALKMILVDLEEVDPDDQPARPVISCDRLNYLACRKLRRRTMVVRDCLVGFLICLCLELAIIEFPATKVKITNYCPQIA